ncbi:Protein DJ-1 homolog B [Galdieria sulphuraria]|uniref:4-methyl-5(B-hydroxyethyl)-thiazole monophosphate biosynthesis n=1 Tax=Galdieria sulphuraria TaxID=130081 RepID=M2XVP9_GALSU|nr:4-methyl-5(b-hydroxyethyl)-thiazole monophosphate biosynthesis [Galdieria sulphuraria]EME27489.1 4-methyl-5(b-hydroxyethyl)-thiazole monophosphate biosynthesis [Galdieria sulphuraria]GJD06457.1 Protein DJ-1 homolog B [Galdieria sulphuraria]|eukprot:XP_005704009.1 4-methyl-5(b-hydroxyethyl)-thiazole monophosphate biosynthesis [Galdieria sulphuraria]
MFLVLVPIANGTEEIEAVCVIDTLRRAGFEVTVASVHDTTSVVCSRQVQIVADCLLSECRDRVYDLIVLPGGAKGAENLAASELLAKLLKRQAVENRWFGAICASPAIVLYSLGLLPARATCHPSVEDKIDNVAKEHIKERVVVDADKKCVTSRGPGTAIEFALQLIECLAGTKLRQEVEYPMITASI